MAKAHENNDFSQHYLSIKSIQENGTELEQVEKKLLQIVKDKILEEIDHNDPNIIQILLDKVASLSAAVYVLEREINGHQAPIHRHLEIDPLRYTEPPRTPQPSFFSKAHLLASDLNPKFGWHDLEKSPTAMWRWAGKTPRAAIFLPPLERGTYRIQATMWPFHDFNIIKDLEVALFGKCHSFSENAPKTQINTGTLKPPKEEDSQLQPEVLVFFINKEISPASLHSIKILESYHSHYLKYQSKKINVKAFDHNRHRILAKQAQEARCLHTIYTMH